MDLPTPAPIPVMPAVENNTKTLENRRKQCLLCPLPNHFLRILPYSSDVFSGGGIQKEEKYLEVGILQARLVKNYGLTSMNPYCRLRFGDVRYETQTALSSAKHPVWNEACRLPVRGNNSLLSVVIMDEGMLMSDSKIAWTTIPLPQGIFEGEVVEAWYELSGKQGQDLEGAINLSLKVKTFVRTIPGQKLPFQQRIDVAPMSIAESPVPAWRGTSSSPKQISVEDVQAVKEIFPSVENDTIQSLLELHNGNREVVTSELLRMTNET
ncbi:unnamed protein product [Calicophoron daubneyi]|uniref:Toll-interacting protein n=1 Tax=Calicophoron daubneyi TaxID=300641 RepID=A0AAV2T908_CALDB